MRGRRIVSALNLRGQAYIPQRLSRHLLAALFFGALLVLFLEKLNTDYPRIGHDYAYFMPSLLAGRAHFAAQGLAPFQYTPYFCGGMVAEANPQNMYYSLLQMLVIVADAWTAIQLTAVIMLVVGYVGWYLFSRDVLRLSSLWSHAAALVVAANGFYLLHIAAGHLTFISFPLAGFFFWLLYRDRPLRAASLAVETAAVALLAGAVLHAGGYVVLLYTLFGILISYPLFLCTAPRWDRAVRDTLVRGIAYAVGAFLVSASKIVAIVSFMHQVPRVYAMEHIGDFPMVVSYIVKTFWSVPQRDDIFEGIPFLIHEKSFLLSRAVFVGLALLPLCIGLPGVLRRSPRRKIAITLSVLGAVFFLVSIAQGGGSVTAPLFQLPFLHSVHVPMRFIYILAVFLSLVGIWGIAAVTRHYMPRASDVLALIALLATIGTFHQGHPPSVMRKVVLNFDYADLRGQMSARSIPPAAREMRDPANILEGQSSRDCYEPLFDSSGRFSKHILVAGPMDTVTDGYFNAINPSCYAYPAANHCAPGDRIAGSDRDNFERFRRNLPVTWKESALQSAARWVSSAAVAISFLIVLLGLNAWLLPQKGRGINSTGRAPARRIASLPGTEAKKRRRAGNPAR